MSGSFEIIPTTVVIGKTYRFTIITFANEESGDSNQDFENICIAIILGLEAILAIKIINLS
jgi:hypothetical protein